MKILEGPDGIAHLIAAGYESIRDPFRDDRAGYSGSFQKSISDPHGRLYFITVRVSRLPIHGREQHFYAADAQFRRNNPSDEEVFNVEYFAGGKSIEQIEAFFAEMFRVMNADRYDMDGESMAS